MNRKEFFRYAGSIILGIIGVTHLLKTLHQHGIGQPKAVGGIGYGTTPYGGPKKN